MLTDGVYFRCNHTINWIEPSVLLPGRLKHHTKESWFLPHWCCDGLEPKSHWERLQVTTKFSHNNMLCVQMLTLLDRWGDSELKLLFAECQVQVFVLLQLIQASVLKEQVMASSSFCCSWSFDELGCGSMRIYMETRQDRVIDAGIFSLSLYGVHCSWRWTSVSTNIKRHHQNNDSTHHQLIPE